jgi:uncharacterized membrane protein (UPF0127 family)
MAEAELIRSLGRTAAVRVSPRGREVARRIRLCRGFGSKFLGLMFRTSLSEEEGALLVYSRTSRAQTSIHMFFVPFPIGVFWLDEEGRIVDRVKALPWRPYYAPAKPARYVLELHPGALDILHAGDRVEFYETPSRG